MAGSDKRKLDNEASERSFDQYTVETNDSELLATMDISTIWRQKNLVPGVLLVPPGHRANVSRTSSSSLAWEACPVSRGESIRMIYRYTYFA